MKYKIAKLYIIWNHPGMEYCPNHWNPARMVPRKLNRLLRFQLLHQHFQPLLSRNRKSWIKLKGKDPWEKKLQIFPICPEYLKKSRPQKLVKSNKSISRKFFLTKFHFLQFQKWPKINFWTGKRLKLPEMQYLEEIFIYLFDFTSFFAWNLF